MADQQYICTLITIVQHFKVVKYLTILIAFQYDVTYPTLFLLIKMKLITFIHARA